MSNYEENRARWTAEALRPYSGQWVAFSRDGSRILGAAESLHELEEGLTRIGQDPQEVALERTELDDGLLGGVELL